jgi:hypothetical protein
VWEAQRGGPRRKRKATIAVPQKANPVDVAKMRAKASASNRVASGIMASAASFQADALQQSNPMEALAGLGALGNAFPPGLSMAGPQWQMLANGAYQHAMAQQGMAASYFPLTAQLPMTSAGFQFGANPLWAQPASLLAMQQHQQAMLVNAGTIAAQAGIAVQPPPAKKAKTTEEDAVDENKGPDEITSASEAPKSEEVPEGEEVPNDE